MGTITGFIVYKASLILYHSDVYINIINIIIKKDTSSLSLISKEDTFLFEHDCFNYNSKHINIVTV